MLLTSLECHNIVDYTAIENMNLEKLLLDTRTIRPSVVILIVTDVQAVVIVVSVGIHLLSFHHVNFS